MVQLSKFPSQEASRHAVFFGRPHDPASMRICVLGTRGFPHVQGGIEAHCENLYTRLADQGCEVIVFARKRYVKLDKPYIYKRVLVVPLPCLKNKFLEAFLHTFLGIFAAVKYRPDILHIHAIGPSFFAPVGRFLGMRVVVTNHGPDYERKKWGKTARAFLKLSELIGFLFSMRVIAISSGIMKKHPRFAAKMSVIPNGVVASSVISDDDVIRQFGLISGKYILTVGRFVPEKGFIDLIDAFESFQKAEPEAADMKLVIVGKADHETAYSLLLEKRAGLNAHIVLTGFLTGQAIAQIYSHAGLFVLASYHEGLSLALLEALGYGLSCVASDIEPNHIVELGANRYYPAGDVRELEQRIRRNLAEPLTGEQKERQIRMIRRQYDWDRISRETLKTYRDIL